MRRKRRKRGEKEEEEKKGREEKRRKEKREKKLFEDFGTVRVRARARGGAKRRARACVRAWPARVHDVRARARATRLGDPGDSPRLARDSATLKTRRHALPAGVAWCVHARGATGTGRGTRWTGDGGGEHVDRVV